MNKNKILAKIDPMVGREFLIETKTETITDYSLQANTITVTTDKRTRTFSEDQFFDWVKKCLPVQGDSEELLDQIKEFEAEKKNLPDPYKKKGNETVVYRPSFTSSNFSDLRKVLMDNIEKVQNNKDYLPQAVAVRDNVQSIIELTKNEIEYAKVLTRMTR